MSADDPNKNGGLHNEDDDMDGAEAVAFEERQGAAAEAQARAATATAAAQPQPDQPPTAATTNPHAAVPPPDPLSLPPHGTEVYVANLDPTPGSGVDEAKLRAEAEARCGPVFEVRMPRHKDSGQPRGFAFVVFREREGAQRALTELAGLDLLGAPNPAAAAGQLPRRRLRVALSDVRNRLYIGNLPREAGWDAARLEQALLACGAVGIEQQQPQAAAAMAADGEQPAPPPAAAAAAVEVALDRERPGCSRGFGFAAFYNHACAMAAIRALTPIPEGTDPSAATPEQQERARVVQGHFGGRLPVATLAEPRRADEAAAAQAAVKSVYVGGLPTGPDGSAAVSEEEVRGVFEAYGRVERVALLGQPSQQQQQQQQQQKRRDYCFVHFSERAEALKCVEACALSPPELGGQTLSVALAKPTAGAGGGGRDERGGRGGGGRGMGGRGGRGGGRRDGGGGDYGGGYGGDQQQVGYGGGGYGGMQQQQQQQQQQWAYSGGRGVSAVGGGGGGGMAMGAGGGGGMMAAGAGGLVPVMMPNGMLGYVMAPAAGAGGAMMMGGGAMFNSGGAMGGGGGGGGGPQRRGYSGGRGGGGDGGGRGRGRGRGGSGGDGYRPY
jgi:heterogeneous nuclear ribonucleoprotein R